MDNILSTLGMATRARQAVSGEFSTEKAVKEGKAFLVIVAKDASANTKKLFHDKCSFYHVPIIEYGDKDSLGHAMGQQERASAALLQKGFADSILKKTDFKEIGD